MARNHSHSHQGVLATKMRYFGVKSTNVHRGQMGTNPAEVTHRPSWPTKATKPGLFPLAIINSELRVRVRAAFGDGQVCVSPRDDLSVVRGLSRAVLCLSDPPPLVADQSHSTRPFLRDGRPFCKKRSSLRVGGPKLLKWGLSERGSNLLQSRRLLLPTTPRRGRASRCVCDRPVQLQKIDMQAY